MQRRDGYYYDDPYDAYYYNNYYRRRPGKSYAERVNEFEKKVFGGLAKAVIRGGKSVGSKSRRIAKRLQYGARTSARAAVTGTQNLVYGTALGARKVAQATKYGIQRVGQVANYGASKIGQGLERVSARTRRLNRNIARAGSAAANGISYVAKNYVKSADIARKTVGRSLSNVGRAYKDGISRIGRVASRGLHKIAKAYRRRIGRVQPYPIYSAVYDGVSRIGEMASSGAQTFGGIATDGVDRIAEVARVIPDGLAAAAREKKIQDCLLQTMCYISTPYLDSNDLKRRKR